MVANRKCFIEGTFVAIGTDRDRKTGAMRAPIAANPSDCEAEPEISAIVTTKR